MRTALLDPRFAENLKTRFPSWCTIMQVNATRNDFFELVDGTLTPLVGHENLRCLKAFNQARATADEQEVRTGRSTYDDQNPQLNLGAYFPGILTTHVARVDNVDYNIRGVVHNSTKTLTRLRLELIS